MGQKINSILLRKGFTNFWENSWYLDNLNYPKYFFFEYTINFYLICFFKRLSLKIERVSLKQKNYKIFIYITYYKLHLRKIRQFKKQKRLRRLKKNYFYKMMTKNRRTQKYKLIKYFIKNFYKKKKKNKKKFLYKKNFYIVLKFILRFYRLIFFYRMKKKLYNLKFIKNHMSFFFKRKKPLFFLFNLNKFFLLNLENRKFKFILRKTTKLKFYRNKFDLIFVLNISLILKNLKFFSDFLAVSLFYYKRKYYSFFVFLSSLFSVYKLRIYKKYLKGFRLRIGGKVRGRKKNRSNYFMVSKGGLSLMSFNSIISYGYSSSRTPFGVLGIKIWCSFYIKNYVKLFKI